MGEVDGGLFTAATPIASRYGKRRLEVERVTRQREKGVCVLNPSGSARRNCDDWHRTNEVKLAQQTSPKGEEWVHTPSRHDAANHGHS